MHNKLALNIKAGKVCSSTNNIFKLSFVNNFNYILFCLKKWLGLAVGLV